MSAPYFAIIVAFEESAPAVYCDAPTDEQAARLDRWVREHPEPDDLLTTACGLADRREGGPA